MPFLIPINRLHAYRRLGFALVAIACVAALLFAFYAQYQWGLEPCPLCIFQRLVFVALALIAGVTSLIHPRAWGLHLASLLTLGTALIGAGLAARQLWLQYLPADQVPLCGPGLEYLIETLPLSSVIQHVLSGSGECAKLTWSLLGISMPGWVLAFFSVVVLFTLWQWQCRGKY